MSVIPDYRDIVDLLKKGATLEAQEKIMELRVAALCLQEENIKLREKVRDYEQRANLDWDGLVYWLKLDQGETERTGPFCQTCHDADGKLSRLRKNQSMSGHPTWFCSVCEREFYIE